MGIFWKTLAAVLPAIVMPVSVVRAMECPAAPQNVAKEIVTDTQGSVNGLKFIVGGELRNRVEVTAKNLFEKYPNADRITVATLMMSQFCQQIDHSPQLSDKEKLDRLSVVNEQLITLMTK
jgi:hypothetical protein